MKSLWCDSLKQQQQQQQQQPQKNYARTGACLRQCVIKGNVPQKKICKADKDHKDRRPCSLLRSKQGKRMIMQDLLVSFIWFSMVLTQESGNHGALT
jgi:hypothetical protein